MAGKKRTTAPGVGGGDVDITAQIDTSFEGSPASTAGGRFAGISLDSSELPFFGARSEPADRSYLQDIAGEFDTTTYTRSFPRADPGYTSYLEFDQPYGPDPRYELARLTGGNLDLPPPPFHPPPGGSGSSSDDFNVSNMMTPYIPPRAVPGPGWEEADFRDADDFIEGSLGGSRTIGDYEAASEKAARIRADLRDKYARSSRFSKIGGEEFLKEERSLRVEAGLDVEEKTTSWQRFTEDKMGMAFGFGYAAMSLGQGAAQYAAKTQAGDYVTPEQRSAMGAEAIAPAAGMAIGTFAGVFGPEAGLAGQFIGGAIGQGGASIYAASQERAQASRQIGDEMVASLGEATSKLKEFSAQVEATGAPLKQVQEVLGTIGGTAPLGEGAATGAGRWTNALGEYAGEVSTSVARQLRNPLTANLRAVFGMQGNLNGQQAGDLATIAAIEGDPQALQDDEKAIQAAGYINDPRYQKAATAANEGSDWWGDLKEYNPVTGVLPIVQRLWRGHQGAQEKEDIESKYPGDPNAQHRRDLLKALGVDAQNQQGAEADLSAAQGALDRVGLTGGSAAQVAAASGGYFTAVTAGVSTEDDVIAQLTKELSTADDDTKPYLQAKLSQARAARAQFENSGLQRRRANSDLDVSERSGLFDADQTIATLRGADPRALAGAADRFAGFLDDMSDRSDIYNPAERATFGTSAARLRYQSGEDIFDYDTGQVGVQGADLDAALGGARRTGSFAAVARAQRRIAGNDLQQVFRDQQRIAEGVDWQEQQRLSVEISRLTDQAAQTNYQAGIDEYEGSRGAAQARASDPGLSRRLRLLGNAAIRDTDLDALRSVLDIDRGEVSRNTDPKRADALLQRERADEADLAERTDLSRVYRDPASTSNRLYSDETDFDIARLAPWAGGPDANPWQRGAAVERDYQGRISRRNADRAARMKRGDWDDIAQGSYLEADRGDRLRVAEMEHERMYAMYDAVPEMIGGSPGGGIGAAVINPAAISAYFNPSPVAGGFGRTPGIAAMTAPSAAAGFMGAAATNGVDTKTTNSLLQQIVMLLSRGGGINAGGHPGQDATGVANMFLNKTFDPLSNR